MKKLAKFTTLLGLFSALAFAESWTGTLVDSSCMSSNKSSSECAPTASTSSFAIVLADGKMAKLDDAGNSKAADALKNNADRSANPNSKKALSAKVTGTLSGDTIKVDAIEVQ